MLLFNNMYTVIHSAKILSFLARDEIMLSALCYSPSVRPSV